MYEARWKTSASYTQLDVKADSRQYYKPTATDDVGVFVEGPNLFIGTKTSDQYYRPGWIITLEAVP